MNKKPPVIAIGMDPGTTYAGVASVYWDGRPGTRPILIDVRAVWGAWPDTWGVRMRDAIESVHAKSIASIDAGTDTRIVAAVEKWPDKRRKGRHVNLVRPAIAAGRMSERCIVAGLPYPREVFNGDWTKRLGVTHKQQVGFEAPGQHRLREVNIFCVGARAALEQIRPTCQIDCAEAIMIAVYAAWES